LYCCNYCTVITQWYPVNVLNFLYWTLPKNELKIWQTLCGFKISETTQSQKLVSNLVFRTTDTNRLVFYPIPCGIFHMNAIDMQHVNKLRFEMEIDNSNWITSGSASNLTLNNVYLAFGSKELASFDRNLTLKMIKDNPHVYQFLDFDRAQFNNKALTASSTIKFELDQFNHKSAFLLINILGASNAHTGTQLIDWYDISNSGRIDLLTEGEEFIDWKRKCFI